MSVSLIPFFVVLLNFSFSAFHVSTHTLKIQQIIFIVPFDFYQQNMKLHMYKAATTYFQTFFCLSHIWQCSYSCGSWSAEKSIPIISSVSSECSLSCTSRHWHVWICTCLCQHKLDTAISSWDLYSSTGFKWVLTNVVVALFAKSQGGLHLFSFFWEDLI